MNEGLSTFIHFHWAEKKYFVVERLIDKKIDFTFSNNPCPNGLDVYLYINDDIFSSRVCGIDRRLLSGLPERGLVSVHGDVSRYGFNYNKNSFEQVNSL